LRGSLGLFNSDSKDKNNDMIYTMNRTIHGLHENLTALNNALESKDDIIQELSEQLEEYEEEADKRRDAYVALKEGVAQLQEENVRLEEVLDGREVEILDIANNLKMTQIELTNEVTVSESLRLLLDELQRRLNYQQSMIIKLIYELDFITQEKINALYDNEKMNKELLETNDRLQIQNETIAIMEEQLGNYTKTAAISNEENKKGYFF
jgi:chromosome segregation ATPase